MYIDIEIATTTPASKKNVDNISQMPAWRDI